MVRTRLGHLVVGAAIGAVVTSGISYAAIPHSRTKQITGCVTKSGLAKGTLRIIDAQRGAACRSTETRLEWSATGVNWRGNWSAAPEYRVNDAVFYGGSTWRAIAIHTNVTPGSDATKWRYLARAGTDGVDGTDGTDGTDGNDATLDRPGHVTTSAGGGGSMVSAALGTDGYPIIAHTVSGALLVTHCENVACSDSATATADDPVDVVGTFPSIAIGSDGLPIISHLNDTEDALRFTRCLNTACTSATSANIDDPGTAVGRYSSLAVGVDGLPIISHWDALNEAVRVTHCGDLMCSASTSTTVDNPAAAVGTLGSLVIGSDGLAVIAHHNDGSDALRITHCDNVACTSATSNDVDDTADNTGFFPDIALGADGFPIIAYGNFTGFALRVAHCTDVTCSGWSAATVEDIADNVGFYPALAITPDGLPFVAHVDATNQVLRVSRCTSVNCSTASTVATEDPGFNIQYLTDAIVGADGLPLIVYPDTNAVELIVTHCANVFCLPHVRP